jgi:hypothetical protein
MIVSRIHPSKISQLWDQVGPYLADGIKFAGDDYTIDQIKVFLTLDQWLLVGFWEGEKLAGAISVAFSNMPNYRIAFITSMGGKTLITDDNLTQFKILLKSFGATKIQGCVRKSVARLLRRLDFKERYILVERLL